MRIRFTRAPAITRAATATVVFTAALTASALAGAVPGAGASTVAQLCVGQTCGTFGSGPGYPNPIPYTDGTVKYVLKVTPSTLPPHAYWQAATFAQTGLYGTPGEVTTAVSSISIPRFDAAGQATCIDFTYISGGRAYGIFIISSAAAPGTWKQNGTTQNCAVAS